MNKINIFWKQRVSCAVVQNDGTTIFFSFAQSVSHSIETPRRSAHMSVFLPKIYVISGHLWHNVGQRHSAM